MVTRIFNVSTKRLFSTFPKHNDDQVQLTTQDAGAIWEDGRLGRPSTQPRTRTGTQPGTRPGTRSDRQQTTVPAACHIEMPAFSLVSRGIESGDARYASAAASKAVSCEVLWNGYIDGSGTGSVLRSLHNS